MLILNTIFQPLTLASKKIVNIYSFLLKIKTILYIFVINIEKVFYCKIFERIKYLITPGTSHLSLITFNFDSRIKIEKIDEFTP